MTVVSPSAHGNVQLESERVSVFVFYACQEKARKRRDRVSGSAGEVGLEFVVDDALESMER